MLIFLKSNSKQQSGEYFEIIHEYGVFFNEQPETTAAVDFVVLPGIIIRFSLSTIRPNAWQQTLRSEESK